MINGNGNLILNGITDPELVKILEVKIRHEGSLNFNPQAMQVGFQPRPGQPVPVHRPGQPAPQVQQIQVYNNVALQWSTEKGLEAVQEVLHFLLKKEEKAEKAEGQ